MLKNLPDGWTSASLKEITDKLVDGSHNPPKSKIVVYLCLVLGI